MAEPGRCQYEVGDLGWRYKHTAVGVAVVGWGAWLLAAEECGELAVRWCGGGRGDEAGDGEEGWGVEVHGD